MATLRDRSARENFNPRNKIGDSVTDHTEIISHVIGKRRPKKKRRIDPNNVHEASEYEEKENPDKTKLTEAAYHQGNTNKQTMKEMIREELEEFAYQNKERKRRSNNVIIHGLIEREEIDDETQIKKIFKAVNVEPNPKSFKRLGFDSRSSNMRPIKMVMRSERHKTSFMKNLNKLKMAEIELRRISITHDLTLAERKRNAEMRKIKKQRGKENSQERK